MRFRVRWVWTAPYTTSIFSHMYVRHEAVTVLLHHWKESLMYSKMLVTFPRSGNYGFFSRNINYKHICLMVSFPIFVRVFLIRSAYSCCGCYFVAVVVHKYRRCCCCCCCHQHFSSIWIVTDLNSNWYQKKILLGWKLTTVSKRLLKKNSNAIGSVRNRCH